MFPSSLCPVTSESRISWRNRHHIEKIPAWLLRRLQNAGVVQSDNKKIECITLCITKQINHLHHYHCNIVITAGFCPTNTGRFSGLLGGKQFFFSMLSKTVMSPYLEIWIGIFFSLVWTPRSILVVQSSLRWSVTHILWIPRRGKYSSARDCIIFHSEGIAAASDIWIRENQVKEKRISLIKNHSALTIKSPTRSLSSSEVSDWVQGDTIL